MVVAHYAVELILLFGYKIQMSAKNPSGLTSYSYEVTFGAGTLGINLQATRSGKGVIPKDVSSLK